MNSEDFQVSKQSLTYLIYRGQPQFQLFQEFKKFIQETPEIQPQIIHSSHNLNEQYNIDLIQVDRLTKFIQSKGGLYQAESYVQYFGDFVSPNVQRFFQIQLLNLRILKTITQNKELQNLLAQANTLKVSLSLLSNEQAFNGSLQLSELSTSIQFENNQATLYSKEGIYKIGNNYQGKFGTHALVTCKNQDKIYLALIQLKDNKVKEKWLGKTISIYQNYAIQFEGSKVMKYIELNQEDLELIEQWESHQGFEDCQIALREIMRLTDICYKYCSMRKQFRTTDDKTERPILTYQVTLTRLINAISFAVMFYISVQEARKEFFQDVFMKKARRKVSKKFVDFFSLYITEHSVYVAEQLRDVFGGFGFLRISGVPQIQEKLIWLSSFYKNNRIQKQTDYLNTILDVEKNKQVVLYYLGQYFMGDPVSMFAELGPLTQSNVSNPFHVFGYHVAKIKEKLLQQEHLKYSYSAYQFSQLTFELFASQKFFALLAFRRYRASNFILDRLLLNQNFISLSLMETNITNINLIKQQIGQNAQELLTVLNLLIDSYEFEHYGILLGQNDQEKFYQKLIHASKYENNRNLEQVVNEIRLPVQDLFNRPTL
ncbi:unnamed protein product [Paramecium primaurelia]|uniref:Acyl-CoA oxidase C-alpha1 domain-containing protein n=1 Tax=Paramecium primaurelia TaxID=5886 RepID=A0A8S1K086_PARPR|nr:unnamed protein product [Paramecium primaurelia]